MDEFKIKVEVRHITGRFEVPRENDNGKKVID